jgi:hypothetical protein
MKNEKQPYGIGNLAYALLWFFAGICSCGTIWLFTTL